MQQVLDVELQGTGAAAVWMSVSSGHIQAAYGDSRTEALPGSVVKPFVLRAALNEHVISQHTAVACSGQTLAGGHNLACTHPRAVTVLDARQALSNSCNSYFAAVARRLSAADLKRQLTASGFQVRALPETPEAKVLLALGLEAITTTPEALARGYRQLAMEMKEDGASAAVLRDGLRDSVQSGMAHAAFTGGVDLAGKTGSAHNRTSQGQHGWFAGIVYATESGAPEHVLVIYLPGGGGNDAAARAHAILAKVSR